MGRPLLQTVAEQQQLINRLNRVVAVQAAQIKHIATLAGVSKSVDAIEKFADIDNPADPVPDPPGQPPTETTEEAATPEAYDDVRRPGLTPGSVGGVPAETTDVALQPGESLPTSPYGPDGLQDVTAPIEGTQTHVPNEQTRIETDVRVGDPMNPQIAYPWGMGANNSNGGRAASLQGQEPAPAQDAGTARFMASVRLARLQIQAGMVQGDDLVVAAGIQSSEISDHDIQTQIETLGSVQKAASLGQQRPGNLVPRAASVAGQTQRVAPSVVGDRAALSQHTASSVTDDTADADLFLD